MPDATKRNDQIRETKAAPASVAATKSLIRAREEQMVMDNDDKMTPIPKTMTTK